MVVDVAVDVVDTIVTVIFIKLAVLDFVVFDFFHVFSFKSYTCCCYIPVDVNLDLLSFFVSPVLVAFVVAALVLTFDFMVLYGICVLFLLL